MDPSRALPLSALVIALALLLAACGGGGEGSGGSNRWEVKPIENYPYPVQMLENEAPSAEGRHFSQGEFPGYNTTQYNTNPPTSGKHVGELIQRGFYDERIPNEVAVHHMEHGYSVIWYNCAAEPALTGGECNELRTQLFNLVTPATQTYHVVGGPNPDMPYRIALTAWQFMDTMDTFDAERIETFMRTFNCHYDPEGGC